MEIWKDRRLSLEKIQERTRGNLTEGQARTLSELIQEVQVAEILPKVNPKEIRRLATDLFVGQHLEDPELREFIVQVFPQKRRR